MKDLIRDNIIVIVMLLYFLFMASFKICLVKDDKAVKNSV